MIINFVPGAEEEEIEEVRGKVLELGYETKQIKGAERVVLGVIGDIENGHRESIRALNSYGCVEQILDISKPYKLLRINASPAIRVKNGIMIDKDHLEIMGGPCTVESREMIKECAKRVKESGVKILRGGAFKPRSDPRDFNGYGQEGLEWLAEAAQEYGLAVITEVLDPRDVGLVAKYADILQIGTRNMHNHNLIKAAADTSLPVLVKRGYAATLDEYLKSAQWVIAQRNPYIILCERGIRTFDPAFRNVMDLNIIAYLHENFPTAIVCADPSHGTGDRALVRRLALASVIAGADCLLVEAHPNPEKAMIDGKQSLCYDGKNSFKELVDSAKMVYALRKALEKGAEKNPSELYNFLAR